MSGLKLLRSGSHSSLRFPGFLFDLWKISNYRENVADDWLHICISAVLGQGNHMVHHAMPGNWNTRKKPPLCVEPGESLASEEEPLKLLTPFFLTWELWQNCSQVVKIEIQSWLFGRHDLVYNAHIPIRRPTPSPTLHTPTVLIWLLNPRIRLAHPSEAALESCRSPCNPALLLLGWGCQSKEQEERWRDTGYTCPEQQFFPP